MTAVRLLRPAAAVLATVCVLLFALGLATGDAVASALGATGAVVGAAGYALSAPVASSGGLDTTDPSHALGLDVAQLAAALLFFALVASLLGNLEAVASVADVGLDSLPASAYAGVLLGVAFGVPVPYLAQYTTAFESAGRSTVANAANAALTVAAYLAFVLLAPVSAGAYVLAYAAGRLAVTGSVALSRR